MKSSPLRSSLLIILSLAVLWSIPGTNAGSSVGNLIPPSFELNALAVSPQGDVAAGSFYALDPTIIPWDLTNPIYRYVAVTLIASNLNNSALSNIAGINITSATNGLAPYHVVLMIQGVQRNTTSIVSDIQTLFGIPPASSFQALTTTPLTLPVSIFASNFTSYSNFANKFAALTSAKSAMIGKYTASLLLASSSGIIFNSLESLTYPVTPIFSSSGIASAVLGISSIGAAIAPAFGLNSTGAVVLHRKSVSFALAQDHTLSFGSLMGQTGGTLSTTNETFAMSLPGGAQVKSFNPPNMLVQSSVGSTLVIGVFPWVGTAQRLVPDVSVTFHYPAYDSPVLNASWITSPSTPSVGQAFTLTLKVNNTGPVDAVNLHFTLAFSGVILTSQPSFYSLQYALAFLAKGTTNTTTLSLQSYALDERFALTASFLDPTNFVYYWSTQFTLAPNVKTSGPVTVTKTVNPSSPAYGQIGSVNVTIHNTGASTFYNVEDLNPDAQIFLYPHGFGANPSQPRGCVGVYYNTFAANANTTHFSFQLVNGLGCAPAVLTRVSTQLGSSTMQSVATPNQLIGPGEFWTPSIPYSIPGGPAGFGQQLTLRLTFLNSANTTDTTYLYPGNFSPQPEDPKTTYLGVYCLPCTVSRGGLTTVSGSLVNATGKPIILQPVLLSYKFANDTLRPLIVTTTNATGGFSYSWTGSSQLPTGDYRLIANYTGSAQYHAAGVYIPVTIVTPTSISPGGYLTWSYPYFFNVTGTFTITSERIAYSSAVNATGTTNLLVGEYISQSQPVTVTVASPVIVPVVDATMNLPKISFLYVAQNQSLVQVNLRVTNTGPQTATNVVVRSLIPQTSTSVFGSSRPYWLPVVSTGPFVTEASNNETVNFSPGTILPGQSYSSWYSVRANSTNLFVTSSNVTAQSGGTQFRFSYTGPVLGVYPTPTPSSLLLPKIGFLKGYVTIDPAVVANNTVTTVSFHLYNAGNVTYTNINASVASYPGSQLTFSTKSKLALDMAPGTSQIVNFTATATAAAFYFSGGVSTYSLGGGFSYNQSRTIGFRDSFYQNVLIFDPTIPSFNPSLRVDISTPTPQVSAGAPALVIVTVTNTGSSNVTGFSYELAAYSPLFNPTGPSTPETVYGGYFTGWAYRLAPGQAVKFRIGLQTRAGGSYPVFASSFSSINYDYSRSGTTLTQHAQISTSSAALITAIDTIPPIASTPWSSPFAPTSSDQVHVWTQVYDGSGVGSVNLEYSTDRLSWTSVPMTPLFGSYAKGQNVPVIQPFFGDIYNVTIPPIGPGAAVFYHIRATDSLGNSGLQDNNGNDYVYFIQGGNSWLFPNQSPGTNILLNGTQYVPGIKTSLFLNVSTPIAVQVIQLSSNPGGTPPAGLSPLGVYTQVNANVSITLNARIRFYYTATQIQGLNASTIAPYYWNGASWTALANVAVNTNQNYVEGTVTHFSLFAVFAKPVSTQPPPTTTPSSQLPWVIIGVIVAAAGVIIAGILVAKRRKRKAANIPSPVAPLPSTGSPTGS